MHRDQQEGRVPDAAATPGAGIARVGPASVAWTWTDRRIGPVVTPRLLREADEVRAVASPPQAGHRLRLGRLLLNVLIADRFRDATTWSVRPQACPRCGGPHAGPGVDGVAALASVSYAGDLVVAAVAPSATVVRLGVDVEPASAGQERIEEVQRAIGTSAERPLRRWARVEAVLKADGRGLLLDPGAVWLRRGGGWIAGESRAYIVVDVPAPPGFLISLAWSVAGVAAPASDPAIRRRGGPAGDRWLPPRA